MEREKGRWFLKGTTRTLRTSAEGEVGSDVFWSTVVEGEGARVGGERGVEKGRRGADEDEVRDWIPRG